MCFLGTVLWLMLVPAGHLHLCSLNRVTVWNQPLCHLPHFCTPQFCRSKLDSHRHFGLFRSKVQFKNLCSKSKDPCCFSTINQTLFIQVLFWSFECDFILELLWLNVLLGSNFSGLKNWIFPQGTKDCQHLRYEKYDYCWSQINRNYWT